VTWVLLVVVVDHGPFVTATRSRKMTVTYSIRYEYRVEPRDWQNCQSAGKSSEAFLGGPGAR
jgi:hypothetical protein